MGAGDSGSYTHKEYIMAVAIDTTELEPFEIPRIDPEDEAEIREIVEMIDEVISTLKWALERPHLYDKEEYDAIKEELGAYRLDRFYFSHRLKDHTGIMSRWGRV